MRVFTPFVYENYRRGCVEFSPSPDDYVYQYFSRGGGGLSLIKVNELLYMYHSYSLLFRLSLGVNLSLEDT